MVGVFMFRVDFKSDSKSPKKKWESGISDVQWRTKKRVPALKGSHATRL